MKEVEFQFTLNFKENALRFNTNILVMIVVHLYIQIRSICQYLLLYVNNLSHNFLIVFTRLLI